MHTCLVFYYIFVRGAREGCHERNQPGTNTISGFQTNQGRVGSTFGNQGGAEDRVGDEMFSVFKAS